MENLSFLFDSFNSEKEINSNSFEILGNNHNEEYECAMKELLKYYLKYNISNVQLEDTAKLMNSMPNSTVKLPTTQYLITKNFFENQTFECFKHVKCTKCNLSIKIKFFGDKVKCECETVVKLTEDNFFVSFKIEKQVEKIVREHWHEIKEFSSEECRIDENYVFDGGIFLKEHKEIGQKYLALTFNTDGVSLQKSNTLSLWPIQITCSFLPPYLRYQRKNIIIAGLYYGKHKPNFSDYLTPLCQEMMQLQTSGVVINNQRFCVFISHASLDLPAKADVQNTIHHNGYSACMYCYHSGERIGTRVKYTYKPSQYQLRTHHEMIKCMHEVHGNKALQSKNGVKGISPMIVFKHFNIVWSFGIDYMHCVLLGVVPDLLNFWLDSSFHKDNFHLANTQKERLNNRMESIKLPGNFSRKIRSTEFRTHYKANEVRSLLLYCLRACLDGILDSKYVNHFQLLSAAIYILLKTKISNEDLEIASEKLDEFVKNYEKFYGKSKMTLNVHLLTHLVDSVRHSGPLCYNSMFAFEDNNATLAGYVNGTTCVLQQISKKYLLQHAERQSTMIIQSNVICQLLNPKYILNTSDVEFLVEHGFEIEEGCEGFTRFCSGNQDTFTSMSYQKATKTVDYFVQLTDGTFANIIFYFKKNVEFAVIEIFQLRKMIDHIYVLEKTDIKKVINVKKIEEKLIYFNIGQNHYAVKPPNKLEKD